MTRELRAVGTVAPDALAAAGAASRLDTLEEVLRSGLAQRPAWALVALIVQDEFTHDVVVRGPGDSFLVFDTT